jgi:two-component system, chemotaxis family, sensor kinase CheA
MKTQQKENFKKELEELLTQLEKYLLDRDNISLPQDLNLIYSLIHEIDNTSSQYGINTISNLFIPIEKGLSKIIEQKNTLNKQKIGIIISTTNVAHALLEDPTLQDTNLKSNYMSLKAEVNGSFKIEEVVEDENIFSNNKFQEIFIEEANDLINQLEEKLLQLEGVPEDLKLIDNVFRIMHTLKGNSNMFGFEHLGKITHHLENIYDAIRAHKLSLDRKILDITLNCIDHFRNLIEDPELSDINNKEIQEAMLSDFEDILQVGAQTHDNIEEKATTNDKIKTYYLFFKPGEHVFDDGTNPLFYVSDLHDIGEIIVQPVISDITTNSNYDPVKCYTSFHILLVTDKTKDVIIDNFMFLHESSQPEINKISDTNLLHNQEYRDILEKSKDINSSIFDSLNNKTEKVEKKENNDYHRNIKTKTSDSSIASIRVASAKIDLMMNLISELVTKQAELSMLSSQNDIPQLQEVAESIESISRDLRDNAFSISLIPLEKSVLRFQRLVRDVSTKFNKKVDFIVEGKETELDKTIIEKIVDPIMHILRNSIDHGIETPEERIKLGKPENGTITLKAYPSGAHVIIEISDDGAGINLEKVRKTAIKKGYIGPQEEISEEEMLKLILTPGFSTTENISEVSGRGVGMDVVSQKIMEIRGELDIETAKNKGTTMTIKLPLTISIIDSLLVLLGETYYLIPLAVVERCAEVPLTRITDSPTEYLNFQKEFIPFIDLHEEFSVKEERTEIQRLIMVNHKGMVVAIVVDQIMGNHQAVLKSLGYIYRKQEIISGASILGNGEVALVLDTNRLIMEFMSTREEIINNINLQNMKAV